MMLCICLFHCHPDLGSQRRHLLLRKIKNAIFNAQSFELLLQERNARWQGGDMPVNVAVPLLATQRQ